MKLVEKRRKIKSKYLGDYETNLDLRRIKKVKKMKFQKITAQELSFNYSKWVNTMTRLIRLKMNYNKNKNFSVELGLVPKEFFLKLQKDLKVPKIMKGKLTINQQGFKYATSTLKFYKKAEKLTEDSIVGFPKLGSKYKIWDEMVFETPLKEHRKVKLNWIRFKFSTETSFLSCTGKFKTFLFRNQNWIEG